MKVERTDLVNAAAEGVITPAAADALWSWLERRAPADAAVPTARFDFVHVAYYFGALLVLGAMGFFMTIGWDAFGGGGVLVISLAYAGAFLAAGNNLWRQRGLRTPGGLLVTLAVGMTPLATYGAQRALGLWPGGDPGGYAGFHEWIRGGWFVMELCTIATTLLALRFYPFPFLVSIIAFVLWYMSMDLAPLLYQGSVTWNDRAWVSTLVGLLVLVAGYVVDRRIEEDFATWLYLFGMLAFWGGLTSMDGSSELRKLLYGLLNVGLVVLSVLLRRRVFIVFGSLGILGYLGYLSHRLFRDSALFPFALTFLGLAVIALGVRAQRNAARYRAAIEALVPESLRMMLPPERPWAPPKSA